MNLRRNALVSINASVRQGAIAFIEAMQVDAEAMSGDTKGLLVSTTAQV